MIRDDVERTRAAVIEGLQFRIARHIRVDETDPTSHQLLTFPKTMMRLREASANAQLLIGDEVLKQSSTHNDFYGFLTCITDPLRTAIAWREKYGETLTVRLVVTVEDYVGIPHTPSDFQSSMNSLWYRRIPVGWIDVTSDEQFARAQKWVKPIDLDTLSELPHPDFFTRQQEDVVIWSSDQQMTDELAAASICDQMLAIKGEYEVLHEPDWFTVRQREIITCFEKN